MLNRRLCNRLFLPLVIVTLCISLFFVKVEATAAIGGNCSDTVQWSFDAKNNTLYIAGLGEMPDYTKSNLAPWYYLKDQINSINIKNGISNIGDYAFYECTGLTSVVIPNSVLELGSSAFQGCTGLTEIKIPQYVTCIASYAFYQCSNLQRIEVPYRVTSIGAYAFENCAGLTDVLLEDGITYIGSGAFSGCTSLEDMTLPKGLTEIRDSVFSGCSSLKSVVIPGRITLIGSYAFSGCKELKSVFHTGDDYSWEHTQILDDTGYLNKADDYYYYNVASCHIWDEGLVTRNATCDAEGEIKLTCVICQYTTTEAISKTDHEYGDWSSIDDATHAKTCVNCETVVSEDHSWDSGNVVLQPNCKEEGELRFSCTVCSANKSDAIRPTVSHEYGDDLVCDICGVDRIVLAIAIEKMPVKTIYKQGTENVDLSGGEILVVFEDGEISRIPMTAEMATGFDASSVGINNLIITYAGKKTVLCITIEADLSGWILEDDKWCYYENNEKITKCWKQDTAGWRYLDANGYVTKNDWVFDDGKWYFLNSEGYMTCNEWKEDSTGWCWLTSSGAMATNQWVKDSKGWCYVGADGYCWTNCWAKDSVGWVWLDKEGSMVYNQWIKDGGSWYYIGSDGYMLANTTWNGYRFNASGVCTNP